MAKHRSGSGNDYRSSSPVRGKGPEDITVALEPYAQWPETSRSSFTLYFYTVTNFQAINLTVYTRNPKSKVKTPFSVNCDSFCMKKTHP